MQIDYASCTTMSQKDVRIMEIENALAAAQRLLASTGGSTGDRNTVSDLLNELKRQAERRAVVTTIVNSTGE